MPSKASAAALLAAAIACLPASARAAADFPLGLRDRLHDAYYEAGVLDYCGLLTYEVHDGYERLVRYLVAASNIDKETERRIRISGWTDADYQFDNHGLVGQRLWCATDGQTYVRKFLDFRSKQLAGGE